MAGKLSNILKLRMRMRNETRERRGEKGGEGERYTRGSPAVKRPARRRSTRLSRPFLFEAGTEARGN